MKKGNKSWRPASVLETFEKHPAYGYRFCANTPENLAKKQAEGWEFANKVADPDVKLDTKEQVNPVTGGMNIRELVLMRMPKEIIEERTAYFDQKTDIQERGVKAELEREAQKQGKAQIHGEIKIETIT